MTFMRITPSYANCFEAAIRFYLIRNTTRMKMFWMELVHHLDALGTMFSCFENTAHVRSIENDQIVLMDLILEHNQN